MTLPEKERFKCLNLSILVFMKDNMPDYFIFQEKELFILGESLRTDLITQGKQYVATDKRGELYECCIAENNGEYTLLAIKSIPEK